MVHFDVLAIIQHVECQSAHSSSLKAESTHAVVWAASWGGYEGTMSDTHHTTIITGATYSSADVEDTSESGELSGGGACLAGADWEGR